MNNKTPEEAAEEYVSLTGYKSDKEVYETSPWIEFDLRQEAFKAGAEWQANHQPPKPIISEWQLCPKCHGDGHLGRYNSPNMGTTCMPVCDVCNGTKTIIKPIIYG